jgi:hypothetical protein
MNCIFITLTEFHDIGTIILQRGIGAGLSHPTETSDSPAEPQIYTGYPRFQSS